jgi:hypothetical protein
MENLDILPLTINNNSIENKAELFKSLDHTIKKNIADTLLAVMEILYQIYNSIKGVPNISISTADGGKEKVFNYIDIYLFIILLENTRTQK